MICTHTMIRFARNRSGALGMVFALALPMVVGFTGLGVDATFWIGEKNKLQSATDSAAVSAAYAAHSGANATSIRSEAGTHYQKIYGTEASQITYQTQNPPISGALAGDTAAVSISATKPQPTYFSSVFGVKNVNVGAKSVAKVTDAGDACILALHPTVDCAVLATGNTTAHLNCGIAANSNDSRAVYFTGSADVKATSVRAVGSVAIGGSAKVSVSPGSTQNNAAPIDDPYGPNGRNLQVPPTSSGCAAHGLRVKKDTTLNPGRYCNGMNFQKGTATLNPGVYVVDGGTFKANAQANVVGSDVTIILTGSGNTYADLRLNGSANLSLHAPKSGPYAGVLFYQDQNAPTYQGSNFIRNKLNGGSKLSLTGALYFPKQVLEFKGGTTNNVNCLQIVAQAVIFSGNSEIQNACSSADGTERIGKLTVELFE